MAIYRGPGGAGDATGDATNASALALAARDEAIASATSAASSSTAAASSASAASTSASDASTSATNAAGSATTASTAATNASTYATNASNSATEAAASASDAADSATAAASSATSASTDASTASTQASNASSSASSASTSASTATTKASEAATSATNAASSATTASTAATNASNSASAAATSETNAASSASSASTSASTATTKASEASSSASSASTSASTATTQASNAASSASAASTSASNASTSATNAASSASSAASSAASAAAALDSFDDRYLGSKTSNPTVDNDGNALATGALYYNSTDGEMRVYDGSQWIAASAASQAILTKYKYVATAGQTTFSGTDANALTLAYTVGSIIVTLNGVVMDAADYTATTGTSIVLGAAASLNDELCVLSFSTFDVANTYTQAQVDAFAVKLTGDQTVAGVKTFSGATTVMNGNVGIGTSSPTGKLHVYNSVSGSPAILNINSVNGGGGTTGVYFRPYQTDTQAASNPAQAAIYAIDNNYSADLTFNTKTAGAIGNALVERARIDSSGNLLVGTTSTFDNVSFLKLQSLGGVATKIAGTSLTSQMSFFNDNGRVGYIGTSGTTTSYNTSSDYRLKENIAPMIGALSVVAALKPVTYTWKADGANGQGFIAHELAEVVPDCVAGEKDAVDADGNPVYQGIDTSFLVATLTAAIQEMKTIIDQQAERIAALENK